MTSLPDPYNYDDDNRGASPTRILSDRGIKDAISAGLIRIEPGFDPEKDRKRIQPASLDLVLDEVDETEPIKHSQQDGFNFKHAFLNRRTFPGRYVSTATLTEILWFGQLQNEQPLMLCPSMEARSSVRRLGGYIYHPGLCITAADRTQIEIGNFSCNSMHFSQGERVAQAIFTVRPRADYLWTLMHDPDHIPKPLEIGEKVRALDMGVEVRDAAQIRMLQREGYMKITPSIKTTRGSLLVHASDTAYRMRKIDGGIDFSKRDSYPKEDLLEKIDISCGYIVQPFEHIIIETIEQMELSPNVGIRFWDNILQSMYNDRLRRKDYKHMMKDWGQNSGMISLSDGWIDPGYKGGFSRQPKWLTGRRIYPGAAIGFGQVFFFPNGVGKAYGDASLGSQYQGKGETQFAK
jgi:deoxycytidine triphosphate deaminase